MSKEIYISSTPHETRLAIVEHDELTEIYYERENEYTLAGSIYNGKVTRVLPGMQSSFVDVGLERDAFLYITDFMEEAGDSAEFDTTDRQGRSDGRRGREAREPQRQEAAAVEGEGSAAPAAESADSQPTDRGDRGDRGRRRRGGNRGGSRDAQAAESNSPTDAPAPLVSAPEPTASLSSSDEAASDGELGEGAPGADGSRRWRGRRGRRRGRSGTRIAGVEDASTPASAEMAASSPDLSSGYDLAESPEEMDFDASAGIDAPSDVHLAAAEEAPIPREPGLPAEPPAPLYESYGSDPQSESGDRGRRDRGGRGGRDRRDDRSRPARGGEPSHSLHRAEEIDSAEYGDAATPGPLVLPGESLSKYREGGNTAPEAAAASAARPPAPDFTLPGAWDGGSVLPGETLRPRASASAGASVAPFRERGRDGGRSETQRGSQRDARREGRGEGSRDTRRNESSTPRPVSEAAFLQTPDADVAFPLPSEAAPVMRDEEGLAVAAPSEAEAQLVDMAPAPSAKSHAAEAGSDPLKAPEAAAPAVKPATATQPVSEQPLAGEREYEPTEGSASYRFDPAPPREFRQPAPEAKEMEVRETEVQEPETAEASSSAVHSVTPSAGTPLMPMVFASEPGAPQADNPANSFGGSVEDVPPAHDLTSITSDGEMLSQTPPPPPALEVAHPTSPLEHETAVVRHVDSEADADVDLLAATDISAAAAAVPEDELPAAPPEISEEADDLIVDELTQEGEVDSEEEDFHTTLHAASIEEMDYDEDEETLEGAADLGVMLREMSIDQITQGPEPAMEEDEDGYSFEEEDATEEAESREAIATAAEAGLMGFTEADFTSRPTADDRAFPQDDAHDLPQAASGGDAAARDDARGDRRRGGRRDGRRGGGRERSSERARPAINGNADSDRSAGGRPGRRDGHRSAQTMNLPAISDLLKPGQEVLVQIAKEPIAKKGARITSHIALPGRFLVFMPTVNHTGVSRKIESDGERRRLKEILLSEKGEASGGFIVRTAASGATEEELRSDLRFLLNLWADIKQRSESSKSPALIYHDLNLVERILRDQVTDNFSAIWVDSESEYERVLRFLQRFQPSLLRRVKLYTKETPMYEQFGITEEINKALRSKVWLKSGGSIVINQTEALVAIDINTGKYVGKTARLEDTIVKTNLDAIPEIVRQIRLRDLGGIIIIDFIDMDERKNRHKVMAVLEEELKKDRAPSKVLPFNDFGLVAITRKRVKQSLERTLSTTCGICAGTGMVKSPVSVCNDIYIEMRKMQKHLDRGDVMLRVNPEVVKQLKSPTAKWLQEMEEMVGKTILVKSDPALHPEQFDIH